MLLYYIFIFNLFYSYKLFNWFPPNLNRHFCFVYFFTINFFKLFSTFSLLYLNCFCLFFSGLFCIFYFNFPAYWLHQGWYYLPVAWLGPPLTFRITPMGHLFTYFGLHFYIFSIFLLIPITYIPHHPSLYALLPFWIDLVLLWGPLPSLPGAACPGFIYR